MIIFLFIMAIDIRPHKQYAKKLAITSLPSSNSIQFWTHEWEKHGTCSEFVVSQHGYFETALSLKGKTNLLKALNSAGKFNFQYFSVLFFK